MKRKLLRLWIKIRPDFKDDSFWADLGMGFVKYLVFVIVIVKIVSFFA
jgi:hypothetical protein